MSWNVRTLTCVVFTTTTSPQIQGGRVGFHFLLSRFPSAEYLEFSIKNPYVRTDIYTLAQGSLLCIEIRLSSAEKSHFSNEFESQTRGHALFCANCCVCAEQIFNRSKTCFIAASGRRISNSLAGGPKS